MKETTRELIKAESRRDTFGFITETVQRGRHRPKKFKHDLTMPVYLYEELRGKGIIKTEDYFMYESAFFEFTDKEATISFVNLFAYEDLVNKIDRYLIIKFAGSYPIKRNGRMF